MTGTDVRAGSCRYLLNQQTLNMINKIELYSLLMKIKYSDNREKIIDETLKVTRFLLTNVMDVKEESLKEIDECFSK